MAGGQKWQAIYNISCTIRGTLQNKIRVSYYDVIIIGGGQSALATAYYLRRTRYTFQLLDAQEAPGGAWRHGWDSLTTFSPARYSSLPGWLMPQTEGPYPTRDEVIDYLRQYETRYHIPVVRPVVVKAVHWYNDWFHIHTTNGKYYSRCLVSATGTWQAPFVPAIPGQSVFAGRQLHSSAYRSPIPFREKRILVIGEGNSGAQILADLVPYARDVHWATRQEPRFLPKEVDGRVLFAMASAKYYAERKGETFDAAPLNLGNIVLVPSIRTAYREGLLVSRGRIDRIIPQGVVWQDGRTDDYDVLIWCTGFHYATGHLEGLVPRDHRGRVATDGTRATEQDGLWLVGYGGWTGFASATMIGVGRSARQTVQDITAYLEGR